MVMVDPTIARSSISESILAALGVFICAVEGIGRLDPASVGAMPALGAQALEPRVPRDYETIQAAIDAAVNGDIVVVAPGSYAEALSSTAGRFTFAPGFRRIRNVSRPRSSTRPSIRPSYVLIPARARAASCPALR